MSYGERRFGGGGRFGGGNFGPKPVEVGKEYDVQILLKRADKATALPGYRDL
jgi:hypothetical protein